jgi:hypothetical protein
MFYFSMSKEQNLPPVTTTPAAKLPPVSMTPVANLPPVSMTPAANFATSFTSVVDTGGKFAIGVNDTGGKLPPVSTTPAANLPPVSTTLVANNVININSIQFNRLFIFFSYTGNIHF